MTINLSRVRLMAKYSLLMLFFMNPSVSLADEIIPDFYKDSGLSNSMESYQDTPEEVIDPFTGSLRYLQGDLSIPGNGGFNLSTMRSYDSNNAKLFNNSTGSGAGLGWSLHFGRVLKKSTISLCSNNFVSIKNNPVLELPDGSRQILANNSSTLNSDGSGSGGSGVSDPFNSGSSGSGVFNTGGSAVFSRSSTNPPTLISTQRWAADCSNGGISVYSPSGIQYDMQHVVSLGNVKAWYTTKISDRNGNYADITYKSSGNSEIDHINTNDGRTINFSYIKGSSDLTSRIETISIDSDHLYTYEYDEIPNLGVKEYWLKKVIRPDGKSWNYEYYGNLNGAAGAYALKKVTYPLGGNVSYEYKRINLYQGSSFMGAIPNVVSKKSSSIENTNAKNIWNYYYSPAKNTGEYDKTTVNTPKGDIVYQHIGVNTVPTIGGVWKIGLLVSKKIGSYQTETYTYLPQEISSQNNQRTGVISTKLDNSYSAPVISKKKITREGQNYTTDYTDYDPYGNPQTITESGSNGGDRATSITYYTDTSQWIVNQIKNETRPGKSVIRDFYDDGNLKSISTNTIKTSYDYDGDGNISSITYPRNITYSYTNYKRGIPQNETQPGRGIPEDGSQPEPITISRVVDDYGNITSETNGENETTGYQYDSMNRIRSIDYPLGNDVSITYPGNTKKTIRGSYTKTETYDSFGRIKKVDNGKTFNSFSYDSMGMRDFSSNPGRGTVGKQYTYDLLGRLTEIEFPDTDGIDGGTAYLSYDKATVSYKDPRGNTKTYSYRAYGNPDDKYLMSITTPESSANITYTRYSSDLVNTMTQGDITRTYAYYPTNYLKSIDNPETGLTTYGRDDAGNMTSIKVGSMPTTNFSYDKRNLLQTTTYPNGTPSVTRGYDKADRIENISNSQSNRIFGYDDNGNLTDEWWFIEDLSYHLINAYNDNDHLESITYPKTNRVVNYGVDNVGRHTSITDHINLVNYWPSGQFKNINYSNGVTSSFGEDNKMLVDELKITGSTAFVDNEYVYDKNGNLKNINDLLGTSHNRTFSYDSIDRIDSATGSWGAGDFNYKDAGNLSNKIIGNTYTNYYYDNTKRLKSISGTSYSPVKYDGYGNITQLFWKNFIYDDASNLSCEDCNSANNSREHYYDGLNQRYKTIHGSDTQYEFYNADGLLLLTHSPAKDNQTVEHIYLNGKRIAQHVKDDVEDTTTRLQVKALLQGAYETSSGLMRDDLRTDNLIPTNDPYPSTQQSLNGALLNTTGSNAIVDWVLLELRAANDPSHVEHAYAALLQRDGDLVDPTTGNMLLPFNNITGSFYISVRHRNHLGVITATPRNLENGGISVIDFTSGNLSANGTLVMGQYARKVQGTKLLMWAGDANHDEKIIYQGIGNDLSIVQTNVLLAPGNSGFSNNYVLEGYSDSDFNLDGKTIYSGPGSDTNYIFTNVFLHPGNSSYSSNYIVTGGMANVVSQ